MKSLDTLILFVPLIAGFAQTADQSPPAYFTVYNETDNNTVSQQFVVKINNPSVIAQARAMLANPAAGSAHVIGTVVKAPSYFNAPWSFHVDPASVSFSDFSVEVCDASTSYVEDHLTEVGEALLPDNVWCPWSSHLLAEVPAPAGAATSLRVASAASDSEAAISPGALISIDGQNLTGQTEQAGSSESVLTLAGVTVDIKAASEAENRHLNLLFASPLQVNALLPADLPPGPVSISVTSATGDAFQGASYVAAIGPALFAVSQNNLDYAAATLQRVHADGTTSIESLVAVDLGTGQLAPVPLDFGPSTDELYLSLYGTGFATSNASAVSLLLAGESTPVLFAGPQGQVAGLDQINIPLSRTLSAQPFVDLQPIVRNPNGYPVKTNLVRLLIHSSATDSVE